MVDWDVEDNFDDVEDKEDDSSGVELECIDCGKEGHPIDETRPFMCYKCKLMWT